MEMNIASAQKVLRDTDDSLSHMQGLPPQAAHALAEAKASLAHSAASISTTTNVLHGGDAHLTTTSVAGLAGGQADRLQLVDEDQVYNQDIAKYLQKWGLEEAGFNYNLCAVVGSQSTGKSTLLNKLFGTTFDVMKENERRQTTKGMLNERAAV
jgi:hypothetical protein